MLKLEQAVYALLTADATLTALCPAANITPTEVWNLPATATYPHISFSTTAGAGVGLNDPTPQRTTLRIWVEVKTARSTCIGIADRLRQLLHRQQKNLSGTGLGVYIIKAIPSPPIEREPRTGAFQAVLDFEVIASQT